MTTPPPPHSSPGCAPRRPVRATYAYSSLGVLQRGRGSSRDCMVDARTHHLSPDRITRHASPSRVAVEWQQEAIVPRVPQPYRTSFSAVTSPRRVSRGGGGADADTPYRSPATTPKTPPDFMGRGTTARATMPGRIRPVLAGTKHKSIDELMSPDERNSSSSKLKGKKSDVRFNSTPTTLDDVDGMEQGLPPKPNGMDSSNDMLDTTFDSVFTEAGQSVDSADTKDRVVMDFMQGSPPSTADTHLIQTITFPGEDSIGVKPVDSGFVEGRVEKKTLIQKEYVHMQMISSSAMEKLRQSLPKPNAQTEQIVKELRKSRGLFGKSKNSDKNAKSDSVPTSPQYIHKDKQGRSSTLPSEALLLSQKETVSVKKSLSSSITKIFRRMSPKSLRKLSPKSLRKTGSNKSTPNGSNSSLFGAEICDINIDSISGEDSDQSGLVKHKSPEHVTGTVTADTVVNGAINMAELTEKDDTKPLPNVSARMLKSIENNSVTLNNAERSMYQTFKDKLSPSQRRCTEAISMKQQALRAVEFSDPLEAQKQQQQQQQLQQQQLQRSKLTHPPPPRQLSADQVEKFDRQNTSTNAMIGTGSYPDSARSAPESPKSRASSLRGSTDDVLHSSGGGGPRGSGKPPSGAAGIMSVSMDTGSTVTKKLKPPCTLNVRQVLHSGAAFQFPSMSAESIGGCSLDVYNTGSEPSLSSSRNGTAVGSKSVTTASKRTLHSQDTATTTPGSPSPASPSPATAASRPVPLGDITDTTVNHASGTTTTSVTESASPKTPSYLKLSCALGGYNKYNAYNSPTQQKKLHVIRKQQSDDQNGGAGGECSEDELENAQVPAGVHENGAISNYSSSSAMLLSPTSQQQRTIPVTIQTKKQTVTELNGDAVITRPTVGFSPTKTAPSASDSMLANGDVVDNHNGLDEVDFSIQRITQSEKVKDEILSLDTPTPSKDGAYFLSVCAREEERLQQRCAETEKYLHVELSEESSGRVRAAIGKAKLLTNQKFKQFRGLCKQNMEQNSGEPFHTTAQDLAGFWDMVLIQVDEIDNNFLELEQLRLNGWRTPEKNTPVSETKVTPKTPGSSKPRTPRVGATPKSAKAQEASRQRELARRKLLQAKRQGRQRKQSQNEEVEIYVA